MKDSPRRRIYLAVLLGALVLLTSAERRLAEADFNASAGVRIENNDKPDGDEILNRLVFVDDATDPIILTVGEARHAAVIPVDACVRSLIVDRLSESRAPPFVLASHV